MNILIINGSPKGKGSNTYRLTNAFLEGMKTGLQDSGQNHEVHIEELQVNRMNIKPCLGCFSCWSKTPGKCCIQDDMQEVIAKLLWADVTIWSFPLYYFTVPGSLKNLIDRQLPIVLPFMVEREDQYTPLFCGQGELFRVPELSKRTDEYLGYVKAAGKEYADGGISKETRMKLNELLYPREVFERMADASWGILYLLTPIWTYFIMGTRIAALTGAINSLFPVFMGIFTAWFQKWYPAKIARGS